MTNIEFAGISNRTKGTVNATPAHKDFTSVSGDVLTGEEYEIALEGNTNGGFENIFAVFIDWNQNDLLDDESEVYEIVEAIIASNGNDGKQVTQTIVVPDDTLPGSTRMQVKKIFGTLNYLDPCANSIFVQTEDYTINVADATLSNSTYDSADFTNYPNPVKVYFLFR
jgi:hypothetical protein